MKISRWLLAVAVVGLMSTVAKADSIDPGTKLVGPGGGSTGLFSLNDSNFSGTVNGGTSSKSFDFINATGQLATGVDILITLLTGTPALTFTVDQSQDTYFQDYSVTSLASGQTLIRFFNPFTGEGALGGIPFATDLPSSDSCDGITNCTTETYGADFQLIFYDINGDLLNLPSNEGFSFVGSLATPEPPTALMLLAGAGILLLLKRLW
jgi:hypothetical protein